MVEIAGAVVKKLLSVLLPFRLEEDIWDWTRSESALVLTMERA
jgi:hypothetical protein